MGSDESHVTNVSCIKMGSDENHVTNVSFDESDKVTRTTQSKFSEEKGETKRNQTEVLVHTSLMPVH